ncbi:hypothetical protein F5888DRAFT_232781 [Russula emetica]|nr:hypothetical protein F5888DRAFT_232781 [Russula emetica]
MAAASIYNNQTSADKYYHAPLPITFKSPSPTAIVNDAHYTERPPLKLSFPCGASNVLNTAVINVAGRSLYSISSNSKHTTMVSCRDNVEVATVQWDRHSPRMVLRRKKMKCKEWLKRSQPDDDSRIFTHGNAQFTWVPWQGQTSASGHLIPASRPEISQGIPVGSSLLDSIVLSVVLLRSGYSLGDSQATFGSSDPLYSPTSTYIGFQGRCR